MRAMIKVLALWLGALAVLMAPAVALDRAQAETVVGIMEAYVAASGEVVYHGGGGEVFDYDAISDGLIPAAGFDRDGWIAAHDAVMSGYMAAIPQAEFDAVFDEPLAMLEASTSVTDEQKAMIRAELEPQIQAARDVRQAAAAFAGVVAPLLPRLQVVIFGE